MLAIEFHAVVLSSHILNVLKRNASKSKMIKWFDKGPLLALLMTSAISFVTYWSAYSVFSIRQLWPNKVQSTNIYQMNWLATIFFSYFCQFLHLFVKRTDEQITFSCITTQMQCDFIHYNFGQVARLFSCCLHVYLPSFIKAKKKINALGSPLILSF